MKISVMVPVYITSDQQLAVTMQCVERARRLSQLPFELVVVETESTYLLDCSDIYIHEEAKSTATKSFNRGFKCCSGDYVALLTNDVLVEEGWLESLLACFSEKDDCGLSTLATTQLGHTKQNKIEEGVWFSVAMMKRRKEYFDEEYVNSWDDTDLIMRTYLDGKKMYRNHNCVVEHLVRMTHDEDDNHMKNYERNRQRFTGKYGQHKDHRMFKILTEGWVI